MPPEPTYTTTTDPHGDILYICLYCEQAGMPHVASDFELFTMHMQQRHDGRLHEAPPDPDASPADAHQSMPVPGPEDQEAMAPEGA